MLVKDSIDTGGSDEIESVKHINEEKSSQSISASISSKDTDVKSVQDKSQLNMQLEKIQAEAIRK